MARRRSQSAVGARDRLISSAEYMLGLARSVDASQEEQRCADRLDDLRAHRPVVVQHGWEIGLPPTSGPFLLEADGSVVAVDVVTAPHDPLRAVNYRRADGTVVFEVGRYEQ